MVILNEASRDDDGQPKSWQAKKGYANLTKACALRIDSLINSPAYRHLAFQLSLCETHCCKCFYRLVLF